MCMTAGVGRALGETHARTGPVRAFPLDVSLRQADDPRLRARSPRTADRSSVVLVSRAVPVIGPADFPHGSGSGPGQRAGAASVDRRTTSSGCSTTWRCVCPLASAVSSMSSLPACLHHRGRLSYRGERDHGRRGEFDVVVPDHSDVVRHSNRPASYSACRTPRARRSLAQKTAVGRSGRPRTRYPASFPAVTVRASQDSSQRGGRQAGLTDRREGAPAAVPHLLEAVGAADVGEGTVAALDQGAAPRPGRPPRRRFRRNRPRAGRVPVGDDEGIRVAAEGRDGALDSFAGGQHGAADLVRGDERQVSCGLRRVAGTRADHDAEICLTGGLFHTGGERGEERVRHVEHHDGDHPGGPPAQLPGALSPDVAEGADHFEDAPGVSLRTRSRAG
ncbi:hypothetical protein SALBM135S_03691 [Streptomyces alboniger]